jgi:hypothetical protein
MASVFRIRWSLTKYYLEVAVRIVLLSAFFSRSSGSRPARALPKPATRS